MILAIFLVFITALALRYLARAAVDSYILGTNITGQRSIINRSYAWVAIFSPAIPISTFVAIISFFSLIALVLQILIRGVM